MRCEKKNATVALVFDATRMTVRVSDTGEAAPPNIAAELFDAPVPSKFGLGVGLYHAARFATQVGYRLALTRNAPGDVCFTLEPDTAVKQKTV